MFDILNYILVIMIVIVNGKILFIPYFLKKENLYI